MGVFDIALKEKKEDKPSSIFDVALKTSSEAEINQKKLILLKFGDNLKVLEGSIDEDYKQWNDYAKQLEDIEA